MHLSALRGFVSRSSFPTFWSEVVSPQAAIVTVPASSHKPLQSMGLALPWTWAGAHTGAAVVAAWTMTSSSSTARSRQRQ